MNLVLDLGQVVVRWQPLRLLQQYLPLVCPNETQAQTWSAHIFGHVDWKAFDAGHLSAQDVVQRTVQRLGLPLAPMQNLVDNIGPSLHPIEASLALIQRVRQDPSVRLFYLSNMPAPYARYLEQHHGYWDCFDAGIFSGDIGMAKPDDEIYEHAEDVLSLEPAHTVFVDDTLANVRAAQTRGWQALHLRDPDGLPQLLADHGVWS